MADENTRHRLVILGSGRVGKTSIITRFVNSEYSDTYKETVEDLYCREFDIKGQTLKVDILDTAGNLTFPAMRRLSVSTAHAFLLVYAVDNAGSLEEIKQIREQIKEQRDNYESIPCVVVGNKSDLEDDARQVNKDDVVEWAVKEQLENVLFEISAKENYGIKEIFKKLLDQAKMMNIIPVPETILNDAESNSLIRRLSGHTHRKNSDKAPNGESKMMSKSRSLIRRTSKPKVKSSRDPTKNDCILS
ncbi:unnamed protein product [Owenia fusiformis]|uniref:Uncharacterized protein n=1 Tax=Owenia fusiformis TaxID=6347 RepID=A0A8J1U542_OWEFU|nr:unnamed protein product [Owenia fusiformis]